MVDLAAAQTVVNTTIAQVIKQKENLAKLKRYSFRLCN
jgi:hypothetical protein